MANIIDVYKRQSLNGLTEINQTTGKTRNLLNTNVRD